MLELFLYPIYNGATSTISTCILVRETKIDRGTLKRNGNATLYQWKIHGVLFKVIDGDKEPSIFQEMLMN